VTDKEFLEQVRSGAGLASGRDAESAAAAVLTRIAGRLSWREQRDLAACLPPALRRPVLAAANTDLGYAPPEAFLRDLAADLYVNRSRAAQIAAAVGAVVAELLPPEELRDLKTELHGTFDLVFENNRPAT
jgi:uncharacterized protein (DUF2267 family)